MQELTDPELAERLVSAVATLLRTEHDSRITLVRVPGWFAVPLSGGTHLSTDDQARIVVACASQPDTRLWALSIHDRHRAPMSVQAEIPDLLEFNRELSFLDYVLLATDNDSSSPRWMLACFTDDYLIALGPADSVQHLAGHTITDAFIAFREYASDAAWRPEVRANFEAVARALLRYNDTAPGTTISVPDDTSA